MLADETARSTWRIARFAAAPALAALLTASGCAFFRERQEEPYSLKPSGISAKVAAQRSQEAEAAFSPPRTVEKVEKSLNLALESLSPHNGYQGAWQAARACDWLAEYHPDKARRLAYAERGVSIAREAARLAPDRVEPAYYLAMNLGRLSSIKRTARYVKEMAREAEIAIQRDERFDRAGPHRFLGVLHLRTEGKVFVGFGDLAKGLQHLARAAELFPEDPENRVNYAEALIADEDYAGARRELDAAAALPVSPDLAAEDRDWLKKAAELRQKIKGK
jgi:hypothetical protein